MIIKSFDLNKIKSSKSNFFLVYGKNEGLKKKIIEENLLHKNDSKLERFDENEIINNFENFLSSLLTKSFFEEKRSILISRVIDKILKVFEDIEDKKIEDIKIILNAPILDKKSKLRSFFEKQKEIVCIPVYNDENYTLSLIANDFFKKNKIQISRETINLLVDRCAGDRINLDTELEKISLFLKDKNKITIEEIMTLTNLSENYDISDIADSCLSKNSTKISKILNENNFGEEDCIIIIRTLLAKSKRLKTLLEEILQNKDIDLAISNFKPPIFWKDKTVVKGQIQKWKLKDIENFIYKLSDLELLVKKNYSSSINLTSNFVVENSF
jgi:DNA polymerase-3 subunit delta